MLNIKFSVTRKYGESIGLVYPLVPSDTAIWSGVNVPRDSSSRISSDKLKFDSKTGIFPVPDITGLFDFLLLDRREECGKAVIGELSFIYRRKCFRFLKIYVRYSQQY